MPRRSNFRNKFGWSVPNGSELQHSRCCCPFESFVRNSPPESNSLAAVPRMGSNARPRRAEEEPPSALDRQASSIQAPIDMLLPDAKRCRAHARKPGTNLRILPSRTSPTQEAPCALSRTMPGTCHADASTKVTRTTHRMPRSTQNGLPHGCHFRYGAGSIPGLVAQLRTRRPEPLLSTE